MSLPTLRNRLLREAIPAYLLLLLPTLVVQEVTVYLFTNGFMSLYPTFSGFRLVTLLISLPLASTLLPWLVKTNRLKIFVASDAILTLLLRFYLLCDLFHCYSLQDSFQPLRLGLLMTGFVVMGDALGIRLRSGSREASTGGVRKYLVAFSLIYVPSYFPLGFFFGGVAGYPGFGWLRLGYAFVLAPIISSVVTLSMVSDRLEAGFTYLGSTLVTVFLLSTLLCTGCEPNNLLFLAPLIAGASGVTGGLAFSRVVMVSRRRPLAGARRVYAAFLTIVIAFTILTVAVMSEGAVPQGPTLSNLIATNAQTRPYVGVYAAIPYNWSCCVQVLVNFSGTKPSMFGSGNYLKAGIGIQAPNRYIDGIDYGYRLDAYLIETSRVILEASAWETCDTNLACGAVPWQRIIYQAYYPLALQTPSAAINLTFQMDSGERAAHWYVNGFAFGRFLLPQIALTSFSIGTMEIPPPGWLNAPAFEAYFLQFGIESAHPIENDGWSVIMTHPSFMLNGSWTPIEHARVIQGYASFWKVLFTWGGESYTGVGVTRVTSPEQGFRFAYTGRTASNYEQLW